MATWEASDIVIGETYSSWTGKKMWVTGYEAGGFKWTGPDGMKHITPIREFLSWVRRKEPS